jgi:hypothetical protein
MARPASGMNLSIAQLEQILRTRRSERQRLERKRSKLQRQLDQLDTRINALGGGGGGGGGGGRNGGGRVRNAKSLNEMIAGVLGKASKPMAVGDIAAAVRSGGYRSNSANFRSIVNQTLIKDKRFGSAARGMYQLKK